MSADNGTTPLLENERIQWLLSLDDEEFQRVRKVTRGPVYTRRQIAKYLGTGAAAALAGGASTGSVMGQADENDDVGDVGTPDDPADVFADGITANSVSTDYVQNSLSTTSSDEVSHTRYVGPDDPTTVSEFDVEDGDVWIEVSE